MSEIAQARVKLGKNRVALDCVLSSGVYLFYWFYLTWKQLRGETENPHYPVWHALALLVPIYGLFVIYRHLKTIRELQDKADLMAPLNPGQLLTLLIVAGVVGSVGARLSGVAVFVLGVISVGLTALALVQSQSQLNRYWEHIKGRQLAEARIGIGEVVFVLVGLAIWATYLL